MTRIEKKFAQLRAKGRKAFIPFITAGDPDLETTQQIVLELEEAGADLIELGVPFSDPIADGVVIQRASERALARGTTLSQIIEMVRKIRQTSEVPLLLMSYYNPLMNHGLKELAVDASEAGLDGILVSDLTIEESDRFVEIMESVGLNTVFMVAPTSTRERMQRIATVSTGFLYAVSRTGVTGESSRLPDDLVEFVGLLKAQTDTPVAIGFGISSQEHIKAVWEQSDGAVVGSAIVHEMEKRLGDVEMPRAVGDFVRRLLGT